jgi:hypothetical protein
LRKNRHTNPTELAKGLNPILKGWLNYYGILTVSYPQLEKESSDKYMMEFLHRYYRGKSSVKSKLNRENAFELLTMDIKLPEFPLPGFNLAQTYKKNRCT